MQNDKPKPQQRIVWPHEFVFDKIAKTYPKYTLIGVAESWIPGSGWTGKGCGNDRIRERLSHLAFEGATDFNLIIINQYGEKVRPDFRLKELVPTDHKELQTL